MSGRLHAVFDSEAGVRSALAKLGDDGVPADRVEVRSSAPLAHDIAPTGSKVSSLVSRMAVVGGLLGGTAFFLMVKLTSQAYPLPTGGQPIVPIPTTGIITFEGTAIGAIIFTVATVLFECGLPLRKKEGPLDGHLVEDHVVISVECDEGASTAWTGGALETARD